MIDYLNTMTQPNFLKTKSYGQSPTNTDITVKYYVGGGIESNVSKGTIKQITIKLNMKMILHH